MSLRVEDCTPDCNDTLEVETYFDEEVCLCAESDGEELCVFLNTTDAKTLALYILDKVSEMDD